MNAWGWLFMSGSLALVCGATIWAYLRLLSAPPEEADKPSDLNSKT